MPPVLRLTRIEIRVFDNAIVYCVDIGTTAVMLFFVRPADIRTFTDSDFQSGCFRCVAAHLKSQTPSPSGEAS
jgi:hypothetical protein